MKLDIKIMGVKKRAPMIARLMQETGLDRSCVVLDDRGIAGGGDAWYNAKRAWLSPIPEGVTHRMVLQDDILICNDFIDICNKAIRQFPDAIWSMHSGVWVLPKYRTIDSPYIQIRGCKTSGEAIIMPVEHIEKMIAWSDAVFGRQYKHDDGRIGFYALANNVRMMGTIPSLTEHLQVDSCIPNHNCRKRIAKAWVGKDIGIQNWDTTEYNTTPIMTNDIWIFKDKEERARLLSLLSKWKSDFKQREAVEKNQ